jgi:hypothetical protein
MKNLGTTLLFLFLTYSVQSQVNQSVRVITPGTLNAFVNVNVTSLTVEGIIDARDISFLYKTPVELVSLDLSKANIVSFEKNEAKTMQSSNDASKAVKKLTSIVLPNNLKKIGRNAFSGLKALNTVVIPKSVNTIGDWAFYGCSALKEIVLPSELDSIGSSVFGGCSNLKSIELPSSIRKLDDMALAHYDGEVKIVGAKPNFIIQDSLLFDKSKTRLIKSFHSQPIKLTIPASVSNIGNEVIDNTDVFSVEPNSPFYTIYDDMLFTKDMTKLLNCPISKSGRINLLNSLLYIGKGVFSGCESITEIILPSSINSIESWAFYKCEGLKELILPSSLKVLKQDVIRECNSLIKLILPSLLTIIDVSSVRDCKKVETLNIPETVKSINFSSFRGFDSLKSLYVNSRQPIELHRFTFSNSIFENCMVYVPKGASAAYKNADGWKQFKNIVEVGL